ncbi:MAG: rod shape-determining protein MreC, partial [Planctomycetota bacterium]
MRRKSLLPGALLALLTLLGLFLPSRITWAAREHTLTLLHPMLRLFSPDTVHAQDDSHPSPAVQARLTELQVRFQTDERILNNLRGLPAAAPAAAAGATPPTLDAALGPLGRFLARPIWNGRALYTVDVGTARGVQIGDGVIVQGGGGGEVVATSASTATFAPLTYPNLAVQAMVARSRATGLLTGTGRGLELRYLQLPPAGAGAGAKPTDPASKKSTPLGAGGASAAAAPAPAAADPTGESDPQPVPGDLIVATGRDGLFPEGTPLGHIETVGADPHKTGGLLRITVRPWADPNEADAVRIVPHQPEPIPLPDDPRELRKQYAALEAAIADGRLLAPNH